MNLSGLVSFQDIASNTSEIVLLLLVAALTIGSRKIRTWVENKLNLKFEKSINKNTKIKDMLTELRGLYDADRVKLLQLHNGTYYFGGEGADKCSLTHFVVDRGVAIPTDVGTKYQNIPVTHLTETFHKMSKEGFRVVEVEKEVADPFLQQLLRIDGVEHSIIGPVKDRRGHWRGILIITWMSEAKNRDVTKASEYAQQIADLISSV